METIEKIKVFLIYWYGPDDPQQRWIIVLTVMALMWLPRNTRRLGGILFLVTVACWFVAHWVLMAYEEYTPH